MNTPLTSRARRYITDAARAFEQAPVEGVVVVFLAVTFSYAIEQGDETIATWLQLLVVSLLLLAGAWTGTVLYTLGAWSVRARWAATAAGAAAALLYGLLVPDLELESEGWRALLLAAAAVLWVVAMPALGGARDGAIDRVRSVNGGFLLRVIGAVLYTAALFAGLALALAAIDNLFELDLDGTIYGHVWGWLFLVLAPAIVVGGLADYARPSTTPTAVGGVVHRMTAFLLPPLLALYYAILYAYTIRMAITGEVPKNLLSPMVLAAGALGAITLYLFEPRHDDTTPGARYLRFAPPLFLPLAALGVWAITLRTTQYGWTENRVARLLVVIALAALAAGASVQLARRRRLALHIAPLALAATLLLASIGPWSSLSIARRSQQARLAAVMREAGITAADTVVSARGARVIPAGVYDEFSDVTQYLARNFGYDALPPALAAHIDARGAVHELPERLGLRRAVAPDERRPHRTATLVADAGVEVDGVRIHRISVSEPRRPRARAPHEMPAAQPTATHVITSTAVLEPTQLRIRSGDELLWASLVGLLGVLGATASNDAVELTPEQTRLDVTDSSGRRRGTLVVFSANGRFDGGALKLTSLEGVLLLDVAAANAR